MIYDKIDNFKTYIKVSEDICLGLEYLQQITPDVENGVHEISPRVKAIVSEYTTKETNENGYEAHRDYIDIQYLVSGAEKIYCLPLDYLSEKIAYCKDIDAAFYKEEEIKPQELLMGNGYFAIFFPQDGHMPGLSFKRSEGVKKIVVKIRVH